MVFVTNTSRVFDSLLCHLIYMQIQKTNNKGRNALNNIFRNKYSHILLDQPIIQKKTLSQAKTMATDYS